MAITKALSPNAGIVEIDSSENVCLNCGSSIQDRLLGTGRRAWHKF